MSTKNDVNVQEGFKTRVYPVREDSSAPYDGVSIIVDEEDVHRLKNRKWHIRKYKGTWEVYAIIGKNKESDCNSSIHINLHRLIMGLEPQTKYPWVYFKDGCIYGENVPEVLDFRKSNLFIKERYSTDCTK